MTRDRADLGRRYLLQVVQGDGACVVLVWTGGELKGYHWGATPEQAGARAARAVAAELVELKVAAVCLSDPASKSR